MVWSWTDTSCLTSSAFTSTSVPFTDAVKRGVRQCRVCCYRFILSCTIHLHICRWSASQGLESQVHATEEDVSCGGEKWRGAVVENRGGSVDWDSVKDDGWWRDRVPAVSNLLDDDPGLQSSRAERHNCITHGPITAGRHRTRGQRLLTFTALILRTVISIWLTERTWKTERWVSSFLSPSLHFCSL